MDHPPPDTMLDVESGEDYIYYRIRRHSGSIVYVEIVDVDIVPKDERTYGKSAIQALSQITEWKYSWTTLKVSKNDRGIWCKMDATAPHMVRKEDLLDDIPVFDFSSFSAIHKSSSRTTEVAYKGKSAFIKIARFPFELKWMTQEIQAYHALRHTLLAPKLLGYVSESLDKNRIIGFLVEKIEGRHAGPEDLGPCTSALDRLHQYLIHGDTCKYNIIITSEGPKFIDLEDSVLVGADRWNSKSRDQERLDLASRLDNESGEGRPW